MATSISKRLCASANAIASSFVLGTTVSAISCGVLPRRVLPVPLFMPPVRDANPPREICWMPSICSTTSVASSFSSSLFFRRGEKYADTDSAKNSTGDEVPYTLLTNGTPSGWSTFSPPRRASLK